MKKKKPVRNVRILLRYAWKFAPELFVGKIILLVFRIVLNFMLNISMIQIVIDCVAGKRTFSQAIWFLLATAFVLIVSEIIEGIFNSYLNGLGKQKIHKEIHTKILEKVQDIDLEKYDDADFYNDYIWALEKADVEIINSYENVFKLMEAIVQTLVTVSFTMVYDKFILAFVIIPLVINVVIGSVISELDYNYEQKSNEISRKKNYSRRVFYLSQYAKELKLYPVGKVLIQNFKDSVDAIMQLYKRYGMKVAFLGFINEISNVLISVVALCLYIAFRGAVQGAYTAGTCAAMINAANNMSYYFQQIFGVFPKIKKNGMFAEKIINLIEYESKIEGYRGEMGEEFQKMEWKNVSFRYPKSERFSLKNISFTLQKGEKIAIVGGNGSGKTTLIKLLMRYYDVTGGEILYNGMNIKCITTKDYRRFFSTVFQDFQIYALKLKENIGMCKGEQVHTEKARQALVDCRLPELTWDMEKTMTKEFEKDGLLLSGGQQQKIAIARSFYRGSEIVIMDEASSALDPISEHEMNETVIRQAREKTMVIISHRLATIQHVDKIYYMEDGQILESGTHDELMKINGKYAKMYRIQAEAYQNHM